MAKKQTLAQHMRDEDTYPEVQGHRKDGMDRLLDWLLEVDEKNGKRDTTTVTYDSERADKMLLYNKARWEEKYKDIPFPVDVKEDLKNEIIVSYSGTVPALFAEGKGVVAEGNLKDKKFFIAKRILAKHDENYLPPEVKQSLNKDAK